MSEHETLRAWVPDGKDNNVIETMVAVAISCGLAKHVWGDNVCPIAGRPVTITIIVENAR